MATEAKVNMKVRSAGAPFDPDKLAYLEVAGLRAYYDHKWLRMLKLVVQLMHEQFGLSWWRSVEASYYVTRGSIAWAPANNRPEITRRYIHKFYRLGARYGKGYRYDPFTVGEYEFVYWKLHRYRGQHPDSDVAPYVRCLVDLHSALFGITPEEAEESAVNRAHGTDAIDRVTGRRSRDIEFDWREAERYLGIAYRSVVEKMRKT